jgi:putative transposase
MRAQGFAVESVCAVPRERGCQIAARTYRTWKQPRRPAAWTVAGAQVIDTLLATKEAQPGAHHRARQGRPPGW